jgi:hypothetical protein
MGKGDTKKGDKVGAFRPAIPFFFQSLERLNVRFFMRSFLSCSNIDSVERKVSNLSSEQWGHGTSASCLWMHVMVTAINSTSLRSHPCSTQWTSTSTSRFAQSQQAIWTQRYFPVRAFSLMSSLRQLLAFTTISPDLADDLFKERHQVILDAAKAVQASVEKV